MRAVLLLALLGPGCSEKREQPDPDMCVYWEDDVQSLVQDSCVECHGGDEPAGSYDLTGYLEALGDGSDDQPNVIAGEESSAILQTLGGETVDETHQAFSDLVPTLRQWVLECDAGVRRGRIHEPGIINPHDPNGEFHGQILRESGYDFEVCTDCHGEDFMGGGSEVSCTSCHTEGPTDCSTCHTEELLEVGAHATHLSAPMDGRLPFDECGSCHQRPEAYTDPGHLFVDPEERTLDEPPAEVMLSGTAAFTPEGAMREGPPEYDPDSGTCAGVYCHGATFDDTSAEITMPDWNGTDQAACGTCHGLPPSDHAQDDCALCHSQVVDEMDEIIAPELHVDTMVQVGPADAEGCNGCHGDTSGAPPPDLSGNTATSEITVGAHAAHLEPPFFLSGPVACSDCHTVPEDLEDPGHIDSMLPAEVFPDAVTDSSLASADGAAPTWDREAGTCAGVYCHGGGEGLSMDATEGLLQTPSWTAVGRDQAACGRCHGIPPQTPGHPPVTDGLPGCVDCHSDTVDEFGRIILSGPADAPTSEHMDGEVDVF